MRKVLFFIAMAILLSSTVIGQETSRKEKLDKIRQLNEQIKLLESQIVEPERTDVAAALKAGFRVFRLMPREKSPSDHGTFYSFSTESSDYQKTAQISLENDYFTTGFAGADYGLIADLGDVPLDGVTRDSKSVAFLSNYRPPTVVAAVRAEQTRSRDYRTAEGDVFRSRVKALTGTTYAIRAISFDRADVLAAFRIFREDEDGSLIVFWKMIETFETPKLNRAAQTQDKLKQKSFKDVKVKEENGVVTLTGSQRKP